MFLLRFVFHIVIVAEQALMLARTDNYNDLRKNGRKVA